MAVKTKEKNILEEIKVIKRDGKKTSFTGSKIAIAVKKGFDAIENSEYNAEDANKVYIKVLEDITDEAEIAMVRNVLAELDKQSRN